MPSIRQPSCELRVGSPDRRRNIVRLYSGGELALELVEHRPHVEKVPADRAFLRGPSDLAIHAIQGTNFRGDDIDAQTTRPSRREGTGP